MNRKLHAKLQAALHQPQDISADHLEKTVAAARSAYQSARTKPRIGFFTFLLRQVRFTGALVWALQGASLLFICFLLRVTGGAKTPVYGVTTLLSACAVLAGMTILPVWVRARKYRMLELEVSTRFSQRGLMLAQLIITAAGNLIMLVLAAAIAGKTAAMGATALIWTLLLPYLITCCGCVLLMDRVRAELAVWLCIALGVCLVTGFYVLFRTFSPLHPPASSLVWKLLCPAFFALLMLELGAMLRRAKTMDTVTEF